MDHPPPSHHLYPAQNPLYLQSLPSAAVVTAAAAPSQPHDPTIYTPMSPYKPTNPTSYSLPQLPFPSSAIPYPSYAANSTVFYPPSSSNIGLPHHHQHAYYPFPRSHVVNYNPPIPQPNHHYSSPNDDYLGKLRSEVIFLHQLWHQGPPNSNSNFGDSVGNLHPHLKPSHSTAFKKKHKKNSSPIPVSDNPWPVPPDPTAPPVSESGWPELPPRSTPLATEEDRDRASATRVQQKAVNSFRSFFAGKHGPESGSESDDDQDDASHDDDRAKFDKFLEVFEGDVELKEYYEKNWANGEFLCLICGGTGQMVGRKYKNCLALVQHTVTISNTKKRAAHRAYGQVLCKVLGWDINQLPLVSRNLSLHQGNDMTSAEACKDDPVGVETNHAILVNENKQSGPLVATSDAVEDNAHEKKETSDLPSILDNPGPGDQQGNEMSSVEASKDDPVGVETNIASLVNDNEQSDTSKATSEVREDIAAEKKETSDLPLVLDNPGDQQINDKSNAGTSTNHSDTAKQNTNASLDEFGLIDPPKAGTDTGENNAAEKKETSSLPCIVPDSEVDKTDQYVTLLEPATQI